ncbi:MAG: LysM peptidoglycan-binding domain-containing protein [bacterium]|nr:LysM peptidoglycan-binding domain-containing protein [bacterium]
MRRNAAILLFVLIPLSGCPEQKHELHPAGQDLQAAAPEAGWYRADSDPVSTIEVAPAATGFPSVESPADQATTSAQRTHRVETGDTLYALARRYYNAQERWKDIYAANRDRLAEPDLLRLDTVLVIP